jgi:hypothetical protein
MIKYMHLCVWVKMISYFSTLMNLRTILEGQFALNLRIVIFSFMDVSLNNYLNAS